MAAQASSAGIQTLLEAEKEASKIVQKARMYRVERLKEARKEAEKDIAALKQQKVLEYTKFEKEYAGHSESSTVKVDQETEAKLEQTKTDFAKGRDEVVAMLMRAVTTVKPTLHVNARPAGVAAARE
ncbi:V-type ATPase, G subunit [Allomyces macrogynus ATCC 38327]|uniref:V-type proton ATPase subunit G n=1 Tax=Allomyces macrogynus (strain ATCC 38327) TaxID=578462 RepID=A0A0L0SYL5_ALLM3|nr:V-type ATPase, G subunit [Allomyces macrogynus ATCC 38327]KNE67597.1 V-type ATPase, G subunit [Allomyces macrogynus ATCC 38327]|eukprot:KNE63935.1 V-type ATPase, G subunit [Allomyces macrogynus ATCC 38327]